MMQPTTFNVPALRIPPPPSSARPPVIDSCRSSTVPLTTVTTLSPGSATVSTVGCVQAPMRIRSLLMESRSPYVPGHTRMVLPLGRSATASLTELNAHPLVQTSHGVHEP